MSLSLALQAGALYTFALALSSFGAASARRAALLAACVAVAALPLLSLAPRWPAPEPDLVAVSAALAALEEPAPEGLPAVRQALVLRPSLSAALPWIWGVGLAVSLLRLGADLVAARRLARSARGQEGDVAFSDEIEIPVVVGIFRPLVLLPRSAERWSSSRRALVLAHERAHARGYDNLWLLLARLCACVHWFDPLAWLTARALRDACEQSADDTAIDSGADRSEYAHTLIDLARRGQPVALAMAKPSGLERRVRAALGEPRRSGRASAAARVGLVAAVAAVTLAAAPAPRSPSVAAPANLGSLLEAEADRLVARYEPDGVAIVVMDARSGELVGRADRGGLVDRPVGPGSVVKPFIAAAALESGVSATHRFAEGDMASILECSSNPGAVEIAAKAGGPAIQSVLSRVGLPAPQGVSADRLALGDGILATPMQITSAWVHLAGHGAIAPSVAAQAREMLVRAVEGEKATGRQAQVQGARVAGKTGTSALVLADGSVDPNLFLASFVGLVPADEPDFVILVSVAGARGDEVWGGTVAAPAFRRIVEGM